MGYVDSPPIARHRSLLAALLAGLAAMNLPSLAYAGGTYSADLGITSAPLLPRLDLASTPPGMRGQRRPGAATFASVGWDLRTPDFDGLYLPLVGFRFGLPIVPGPGDWSDAAGDRLHLSAPLFFDLLGPGAGRHWFLDHDDTRLSLGARPAMSVVFASGDALSHTSGRQSLAAFAWGLGVAGELEACHRIWKQSDGWTGLCFLAQPAVYYGSGGAVLELTTALRLTAG